MTGASKRLNNGARDTARFEEYTMKRHTFFAALFGMIASQSAQAAPGEHFMLNWDLDADGIITVAELEERRDIVFNMFDNDQNGLLDAQEYGHFDETRIADMANNAGQEGGGGHRHGGMGRVMAGLTQTYNDTDGDGIVTFEEFIGQTAAWFATIDRNASGDITTDDFGRQ